MKVVGLITEYNPFHNGHKYHIEQALQLTGADTALVVMSGNHVQRGAPAIFPKHLRTEAALSCGAAAVFELPVCYATGSAEFFARGAVALLEKLGCVDFLCFGAESPDLDSMKKIAEILTDEPAVYQDLLKSFLKSGVSFPAARQKALAEYTGKYSDLLEQPNNILGIEYLKAIHQLKSSIVPYALERTGSGYHDLQLHSAFSSASAIRKALSDYGMVEDEYLESVLPKSVHSSLARAWNLRGPICADDYSLLLKYKLLTSTPEQLTEYTDISTDIANRIYKHRNQFVSFDQFCDLLKTKQLTYTRISRALLHILLDVQKKDMRQYLSSGYHGYARLLGFRKDQSQIFASIKENSQIPLISKLTVSDQIEEPFYTMLQHDIFASNLYESIVTEKFKTSFKNEYEQSVVIL